MSVEARERAEGIRERAHEANVRARLMSTLEQQAEYIAIALLHERALQREEDARIAESYQRDASFDDSAVGASEHHANQANIAAAIRKGEER